MAGPVEATAAGNLLVQAQALGHVSSIGEMREIVRRSFSVDTYEPRDGAAWDGAYERFRNMMDKAMEG
jgi:rhamnulokinase